VEFELTKAEVVELAASFFIGFSVVFFPLALGFFLMWMAMRADDRKRREQRLAREQARERREQKRREQRLNDRVERLEQRLVDEVKWLKQRLADEAKWKATGG